MNTTEFFMHPEYALVIDSEEQEVYLEEVREAILRAEDPILVNPSVKNNLSWYGNQIRDMKRRCGFDRLFKPENILLSNSREKGTRFSPQGHIQRDYVEPLVEIVGNGNTASPIVINGCFFGNACLSQLVLQILGLKVEGAHWFAWESSNPPEPLLDDILIRGKVLEGNYLSYADVSYGVCFSMESIDNRGLPFDDSFEKPLIREDTRIYGRKQ